jgi:hypothetical protein
MPLYKDTFILNSCHLFTAYVGSRFLLHFKILSIFYIVSIQRGLIAFKTFLAYFHYFEAYEITLLFVCLSVSIHPFVYSP